MAELKKILVSLPDKLLKEIDEIVSIEKRNRSEFIREAMKLYIRERRKMEMREKLIRGYQDMASINSEWCELGLDDMDETFVKYETMLSGRDAK